MSTNKYPQTNVLFLSLFHLGHQFLGKTLSVNYHGVTTVIARAAC